MSTQPFPLSIWCAVNVTATPLGAVTPTFNQGLIVGNSGRIPSSGPNSRVRQYPTTAAMTSDGFQPDDPEFISAGLYFDQAGPPQIVWVGCQDPTALATITLGNDAGTDYVVGDLISPTQAPGAGGLWEVTAVSEGGVVTAGAVVSGTQGTGYVIGANLPTTGGSGSGLTLNITAIGETPLQAVTACRLAQPGWYTAMSTTAVDADHIAIAGFAQNATPQMQYLYGTQSASAASGATGNVFSAIKAQLLSRAHGTYSTIQAGAAPNNQYVAAAVEGLAMGLNNGLASSNFTLAGKQLVGITTEPISLTTMGIIAGLPGESLGNFGNVYANAANTYNLYSQGVNGSGTFFDQILGLDMLAADAQISIVGELATMLTIPQDNAGQSVLINAATGACSRSGTRGFLATNAVYTGQTFLGLATGTALATGYYVQSPSFSTQSAADRALRKGMPVYITVILAGSQQSFTIGINVQQ